MENEISTGQYAKKWGLIYGLVTLVIALVPLILEVQAQWTGFLLIAVANFCYAYEAILLWFRLARCMERAGNV